MGGVKAALDTGRLVGGDDGELLKEEEGECGGGCRRGLPRGRGSAPAYRGGGRPVLVEEVELRLSLRHS